MARAKKLHYASQSNKPVVASCGRLVQPGDERVSAGSGDVAVSAFWAADADGTLCGNCLRAATNEASPF